MRWRMPKKEELERLPAFAAYVWRRFVEDRGLRMAAGLSYTSLLAIVPLTAIAFSMFAAFPVFEGVRETIQEALFSNLLPDSAATMGGYFDTFVSNATQLTAVGTVGLAATAILLLGTIESDMNAIFRVVKPRALAPRLLMFWAMLTLGPMLIGASFSLSTYVYAATSWVGLGEVGGPGLITRALPTLMVIFALSVFFFIVPNRHVGIGPALAGGLVAGLLFAALRRAFGLYVASAPTYQSVYGAVSVVPIFLVWMYLSWAVVLLGAELTASATEWRSARGRPRQRDLDAGERLTVALAVLAQLLAASRHGAVVTDSNLQRRVRVDETTLSDILAVLHKASFVEQIEEGRWLLSRDLDTVDLNDLMTALDLDLDAPRVRADQAPWRARASEVIAEAAAARRHHMSVPLKKLLHDPESGMDEPRRIAAVDPPAAASR